MYHDHYDLRYSSMRFDPSDIHFSFQLKEKGLKVAYNESSIRLPPQAFSSTQDSRVVTLIYLTLHEVLSLPKADKDESGQPFSPSTTIVSSTVSPRPQDVSSQPVKVALRRNKKVYLFRLF